MTVYIYKSKQTTKKLSELMNEARSQDTRPIYRKQMYVYILKAILEKKLRKSSIQKIIKNTK